MISVESGSVAPLVEHDLVEGADGRVEGRQPSRQVRSLDESIVPGIEVVGLLLVPAGDLVPVVYRYRRLQREYPLGRLVGLRLLGQFEHAADVGDECLPDAGEAVLTVVALVRQRETPCWKMTT